MEPQLLFECFAEICRVPRESGNELGMQRYLEAFAAEHKFNSRADATGNLVIRIPARGAGSEKSPLILQSHTDMVCVKRQGSVHDFSKDPINIHVEQREDRGALQDVLIADNTTLGADNGMGVAAALAAATDPSIVDCPPLELLFTVDEERGLTGASTLDPSLITGRFLINMDSEELGDICISCAGGRDMIATWPITRTITAANRALISVSLSGLPGGHSGAQIDEGRGNAISLLIGELLTALNGAPFGIFEISGGSKRNVIPSTVEIALQVEPDTASVLQAHFEASTTLERIREQVRIGAENIAISVERPQIGAGTLPVSDAQSIDILNTIAAIPWGPQAMSDKVAGLVETSNNVAVISTVDGEITLCCSTRSSKDGAIEDFQDKQRMKLEESGARVMYSDGYPGWEADTENPLLLQAKTTFTRVLGAPPKISAIHAGLECGVIKGIVPDMRMISFGPDILDVHTIQERVLLKSVPPFYRCLTELLSDLTTTLDS